MGPPLQPIRGATNPHSGFNSFLASLSPTKPAPLGATSAGSGQQKPPPTNTNGKQSLTPVLPAAKPENPAGDDSSSPFSWLRNQMSNLSLPQSATGPPPMWRTSGGDETMIPDADVRKQHLSKFFKSQAFPGYSNNNNNGSQPFSTGGTTTPKPEREPMLSDNSGDRNNQVLVVV